MYGSKSQPQTGNTAGAIPKEYSGDWRELANIGACVPNVLYVSRADAADTRMTKCCTLHKKMLQTAGLVFAIVIFFLLPYFAVKVATLSEDMTKLSDGMAVLSGEMNKLKSMTQLRFAELEGDTVS
ncbi:uncharacterized protein LOC118409242 isoform X2 [Branchiostoma floridae]|uniref:Uncharacterized protein LOC118409242 isoform X2 n=1 Tax=Branchiostoma floridae TaxID=7739 RepID=A0A9J7HVF5_BRAFL|nr:uncharacterized protein LOC118409242 isoform X2 [Branchiostoma floridae]